MPKMTQQTRDVLAEFLKDPDAELYGLQVAEATALGRGTAYPILERLEEEGWLESRREGHRGEPDYVPRKGGGPPRRYYCLTAYGKALAPQEVGPNGPGRRPRGGHLTNARDLVQAQQAGATIFLEHIDVEVKYAPRKPGDRLPWVWVGKPVDVSDFRCSSGGLRAVYPEGS